MQGGIQLFMEVYDLDNGHDVELVDRFTVDDCFSWIQHHCRHYWSLWPCGTASELPSDVCGGLLCPGLCHLLWGQQGPLY